VSIDPDLPPYFSKNKVAKRKLTFAPDPISFHGQVPKSAARARLGLNAADRVVLVYGALEWRKGVVELLSASGACPASYPLKIILAGRMPADLDSRVRQMLDANDSLRRRVVWMNEYIEDEFEQTLFSASDAVWVGYINFPNVSGVLWKAVVARRTVLACKEGLIGVQAKRIGAKLFDPSNPDEVLDALMNISSSDEVFPEEFENSHTWKRTYDELVGNSN
jgi:glycosyltransferase involved in cell wall biosynthesis